MMGIDFDGFDGREEKLKRIIRFDMERFTPMFYRTNLFLHAQRVYLLVNDLADSLLSAYGDPEELDVESILSSGSLHTAESVIIPTGITHYDRWRQLTISHFGVYPLIDVKERDK